MMCPSSKCSLCYWRHYCMVVDGRGWLCWWMSFVGYFQHFWQKRKTLFVALTPKQISVLFFALPLFIRMIVLTKVIRFLLLLPHNVLLFLLVVYVRILLWILAIFFFFLIIYFECMSCVCMMYMFMWLDVCMTCMWYYIFVCFSHALSIF